MLHPESVILVGVNGAHPPNNSVLEKKRRDAKSTKAAWQVYTCVHGSSFPRYKTFCKIAGAKKQWEIDLA